MEPKKIKKNTKNSKTRNPEDIIFKECFKINSKDSILIITDRKRMDVSELLFSSAIKYSKKVLLITIPVGKVNGEEPPKRVSELMKEYSIIIAATTKSISHTKARVEACKNGARMASMPGITIDMFKRAVPIDYKSMKISTMKLKKLMDEAKKVRIYTMDTSLEFSIAGRKSIPDYGDLSKAGSFDNLPSGECFIAPIENSADGNYRVVSMGTGIVDVKITMKNGKAVKFEGKGASAVKRQFIGMPKEAFTIAELGIGTNPKAKVKGIVLEDEKVLGTAHIALGNNFSFGGKTKVPIHIDGIIPKPTIYFDEKLIMKRGVPKWNLNG